MNIYEISQEYADKLREIEEYAAEHDGEVPDDMISALMAVDGDFATKAENITKAVKNYLAEAEAYKREADRLADKSIKAKNAAERCKNLLLYGMQAVGKEKEKTSLFSLSIRKSMVVNVFDVDCLPCGFVRIKKEADKTAIKAALESGQDVQGATLGESQSLIIR